MYEKNFWKKYFRVYDTLNDLIPYQNLLNAFVERLKPISGKKILDAGAGTGNLSVIMAHYGGNVWALDSSDEGLSICEAKNSGVHTMVHHLEKTLPFSDDFFDAIVTNNTIYTMPRSTYDPVLREFKRVLKPGGIIIMSNPRTGWSPPAIVWEHFKCLYKKRGIMAMVVNFFRLLPAILLLRHYNVMIEKKMQNQHYTIFSSGEQRRLLDIVGFKILEEGQSVYAGQAEMVVGQK